jgi:nucleoside diphosphate kinase
MSTRPSGEAAQVVLNKRLEDDDGSQSFLEVEEWDQLTRIPLKSHLYSRETYFRDGLYDARRILGDKVERKIRNLALMLIKPEGLRAGKVGVVLDFLDEHGFMVVAADYALLTRFHWRELWRYQLTSATIDRLSVNDLILRGNTLALLVRDKIIGELPTSVRLSGLKGSSDVSKQPISCLRRRLGQDTRLFSFIHVADEPADVVRELGILFDFAERRRVLSESGGSNLTESSRLSVGRSIESVEPSYRLDVNSALDRLEAAFYHAETNSYKCSATFDYLKLQIEIMRTRSRILWLPFIQALENAEIGFGGTDLAVLGANFILYDEPDANKCIDAVDPALWNGSQVKI